MHTIFAQVIGLDCCFASDDFIPANNKDPEMKRVSNIIHFICLQKTKKPALCGILGLRSKFGYNLPKALIKKIKVIHSNHCVHRRRDRPPPENSDTFEMQLKKQINQCQANIRVKFRTQMNFADWFKKTDYYYYEQ